LVENKLISSSYYLQEKHVLLLHCDLGEFLIDYYLAQKDLDQKPTPEQDLKLKKLFAAAALHITQRHPEESLAWTLLMRGSDPYSLFVTASPSEKMLVGRVITDNIRHTDVNIFHAQMSRKKGEISNSSVMCQSDDVERMVEEFYQQSEQLPLKVSLLRSS